jgi:uncharacterized membrane protein
MLRANPVTARHGWAWIRQGLALFRRMPSLWLAMSAVYLAIAIVLEQIPFVGWLILILLTPSLLLGALPLAKALETGSLSPDALPAPLTERTLRHRARYLRELLARAAGRLFQGFAREDALMPVLVISTLLLGGVVVIRILAQLLKVGGAALPAMLSGSVGPTVWLPAILGLLVVLALYVLLLMAFVYTVPLILFRGQHPLPAIEASFRATYENWQAFGVFASVFSLAGELARGLFFLLSFPFDYLAFLVIGLVLLPVLVTGLYAGYLDQFTSRQE